MGLYDKIRNTKCVIPESFDMKIKQAMDILDNTKDRFEVACIAFKFGYMQGRRAEQVFKTNESGCMCASAPDQRGM